MPDHNDEIKRLTAEFESCRKILLALGDENRQHLMLEMMRMEHCGGVRVGAITEKTNLSRPAVPYPNSQGRGHFENASGRHKELLLF